MTTRIKTKRLAICIAVVVLCMSLTAAGLSFSVGGAVLRQGSTGSTVREVQTRLRNWGYYKGNVDGIFGPKTRAAVVWFQRNNGLTQDGIVGAATFRALGIASGGSGGSGVAGYSDSDYKLLARMISAEGRGETYTGMVAIGAVVLNRVKHPSFPNTISGVIYQNGAFTALTDGNFNQPVVDQAYSAARDAMNGWDPSGGAIYYYNPKKTSNQWMRSRPVIVTIGDHVFCR